MMMTWTIHEIEENWLGGSISALALSPETIVAAFDLAERLLGRPWIEKHRANGTLTGTVPTLSVVTTGQKLAALDGIRDGEKLVQGMLREDGSVIAEITAIYLIRSIRRDAQVELYPEVGNRLADFRVRCTGLPWTYVEVTQPDCSEAAERARTVLEHVAVLVTDIKKSFALEVFFKREPNEAELAALIKSLPVFCAQEGIHQKELPYQLGLLFLNQSQPGQLVLDDHGDEVRPRIGMARAIAGTDEPHRHIVVRMAFSDERAEAFMTSEARQLPKDSPGLIMIEMSRAQSGFKSWEPLLKRRFQPRIHTRVSGVCLFSGGFFSTESGEAWLPATKLLLNPFASLGLPAWIGDALTEA
jgi:hypothetical protein